MRLPSPAMVVALIALVIAMSGSAYAVTQLPRNSVGTVQLKKHAVTSAKIKNGTIVTADLSRKARADLKGATGARGETGPRGPAGTASSAFRVGASASIENPTGASAVLDDFAITTPEAGYLLVNLDLTSFSTNGLNLCDAVMNLQVIVTINGVAITDLGFAQARNADLSYAAAAVVQVEAGRQEVVMRLQCATGGTANASTTTVWHASGALYPEQLTATTNTG